MEYHDDFTTRKGMLRPLYKGDSITITYAIKDPTVTRVDTKRIKRHGKRCLPTDRALIKVRVYAYSVLSLITDFR